ncbi:hypothetical protein AAHZ94_15335, partial [Streptomyces sp. HSW2009]|uniref:hypothetical protein n=1 Tax=Streptomyces sp. HSW2009 TaxID=3142890 RepID=UPI0032EDCA54
MALYDPSGLCGPVRPVGLVRLVLLVRLGRFVPTDTARTAWASAAQHLATHRRGGAGGGAGPGRGGGGGGGGRGRGGGG